LVFAPVCPGENPVAIWVAVCPHASVLVTVRVDFEAFTMLEIVAEEAFVPAGFGSHFATAIELSVNEFTFIEFLLVD